MKHATMIVVGLVAIMVSTASAQETTGDVVGRVASQDGAPLPGVTVTIQNAEVGLVRSAVTRGDGTYRFPALAPARYRLTASLDGFQTVQREVEVALGRAATVDLSMQIGSFQEVIEVTGETPLVDVTSTVSGLSVDADALLGTVPVQREVTNVALLAPGTVGTPRYWQEATFTGLYTPEQGFASFGGASIGENSYQINGLNVTSFRHMLGSTFVPMEFVEEVQVKSGGYEAEYGRATGGVVSMLTKSGTNTFQGGLSAYFEPESLQEQEPDTFEYNNQDESRERLEVNASLGGPIARDRLFFFAFARYADTAIVDLYATTADLHETSNPYWGGKLDWAISSNHRLEGTYISDAVDVDFVRSDYDPEARTVGEVRGTGMRSRGGDNVILKYMGMFGDNVLLSAQAGRNEFNRHNFTEGDQCPFARDYRGEVTVNLGCWVRSGQGDDWDARNAYRLDVDWFVGNHQLRAGADFELNESWSDLQYSGGVGYLYYTNGEEGRDPSTYYFPDLPWDQELVRIRYYQRGGLHDVNSNAAYAQDSWRARPDLTVNLGLRWERYENKNSLGETFIETDDQWAPRLGVIWDLSGTGRSKLFASAGLFYLPVASITNILTAGGSFTDDTYYAFDAEINPDGSPTAVGDEVFHYSEDGVVPDPRETISDNFDPTSQTEIILGYEQALGTFWSIGVRGIARWFNQIIEDYTIDTGLWNAYGVECLNPELVTTEAYCYNTGWRLGNPGREFEGWYDLDGDGELDRVTISAEDMGYPEVERRHYAVELTFARRFSNSWMLQGSYTWSHTYGNYEGTTNSDMGNPLAGMHHSFDTPGMMEYGSGDLPNDHRHNLKLFGVYAWDFGLQLGGNVFWRTGIPLNSYGQHPSEPLARWWGYPSFFTEGEPRPRGSLGRTPDVWSLDLMLKYEFAALGLDWNVRADVFNVFDNAAEEWNHHFAEQAWNGVPNEHFGETQYYQTPRSVRFGFGVSF
jgi:outer membrane receptor protein involved in Fe transport